MSGAKKKSNRGGYRAGAGRPPVARRLAEAHVEAMREAIGFGLCGSKFHWTKGKPYEQLARSALAALMKGRTGAPRR